MANKKILLCLCSNARTLDEGAVGAMRQALSAREGVTIVDDLCVQAADRSLLPAVDIVLACNPRALQWLARFAGTPLADSTTILDLASPENLPEALQACDLKASNPAADATAPAAAQG